MKKILSLLVLFLLIASTSPLTTIVGASNTIDNTILARKTYDQALVEEVFSSVVDFKIYRSSSLDKLVEIGYVKPSEEYRSVIVFVDRRAFDLVRENVFKVRYSIVIPGNDIVLTYVVVSRDQLIRLLETPGVRGILPSVNIIELLGLDRKKEFTAYEDGIRNGVKLANAGNGGYGYFGSLDVLGVKRAWDAYGVYGDGVAVGVVDTGIDFSSPELGLNAIARDENGLPLTITCDEYLAFTPVDVVANATGYLNTSGVVVPVYSTIGSATNGVPTYYLVNVTVDYKINLNYTSKSGVYRFGILEWGFMDSYLGYYVAVQVPVVLIDLHVSGVYDTAVFDLSSAFYTLSTTMRNIENQTLGYIMWREPDPTWLDYSFADEPVFTIGENEIIARDFDGDGIYDFSIGSIAGYYLDTWGLTNYTWDPVNQTLVFGEPGQRMGLDPNGTYIAVFTDPYGHGTSVATVIASRGILDYSGYTNQSYKLYGASPHVKLAGGEAFLFGDLLMTEYWIAGWDWIYDSRYGLNPIPGYLVDGQYVSIHRADIVSNSWGYVDIAKQLHQMPDSDILSAYINYVSFGKWIGSLYYTETWIPDNVTLVFAAGNEGPGYGSVSSPAADPWVITVGASTLFEYYQIYGYPPGYADDVAMFSGRGPNAMGYPKPDVLAIGSWEWAGVRTIDGRGYGVIGYWETLVVGPGLTLFGGTSEATPFVSAILALGVQAFRAKYGYTPSPLELKVLLKSSCDDIDYPVLIQGSGRINAYKLLKTIIEDDFTAYIVEGMKSVFQETYGYFYYYELSNWQFLLDQLYDTAYYGVVEPGTTTSFTLYVKGYGQARVDAVTYMAIGRIVLFNGVYDFTTKTFTLPRSMLRGVDYVEVYVLFKNLTYPYPYYGMLPNDYRYMIRVDAFDYYMGQLYRLNAEARVSTTAVLTIGGIGTRVKGDLLIRLRPYPYETPPKYVKALVVVRLYRAIRFSWIRFSQGLFSVSGVKAITGYVRVPRYARPGVYEFKIRVHTWSKMITIPATIIVPFVIDSNKWYGYLYSPYSRTSYDSYTPLGIVDPFYGDSTEQLDWRMIPILVKDWDVAGIVMYAKWRSGYATSLEALVSPPGGPVDIYYDIQRFATYKLTAENGYVYNPSLYDQRRGLLKLYIPIKWAKPYRSADISYYHYYGVERSIYYVKDYVQTGLYRLYITYGSYSGKLLFDRVRIFLAVIRSFQVVNSNPDGTYTVEAYFMAPLFLYRYLRRSEVYSIVEGNAVVIDAVKENVTIGYKDTSSIYMFEAYRIENIVRSRYRFIYIVYVSYVVDGATGREIVETVMKLPRLTWHSSGIYIYDYDTSTLLKPQIYYIPLVSEATPLGIILE